MQLRTDSSAGRSVVNGSAVLPALAIIVLVGLALRMWGVDFGLPYLLHEDEGFEVRRAFQLGAGSFNFRRFTKGLYFYVLFVEYGAYFVWLKITGSISAASEFATLLFRDPTPFYLLGRSTTAVIGTTTVFLVYLAGRTAYGVLPAVLAALFLAVNVTHVELSHYITVDVPMTCLVVAALIFGSRLCTSGLRRDYFFAALFAGLAVSAKAPAIVVLVPLLLAHHYAVDITVTTRVGLARYWANRNLGCAVAVFLATYLLTNPGAIIYLPKHAATLLSPAFADNISNGAFESGANQLASDGLGRIDRAFIYTDHIASSMGAMLFTVATAGLVYALLRRKCADVLLGSFAVTYFLVIVFVDSDLTPPRYVLPLLPILSLLAARVVKDATEALVAESVSRVCVAMIASLVLAAPSAVEAGKGSYLLTQKDTRVLAREWFDSNVDYGTKVFVNGNNGRVSGQTVPLRKSAKTIRYYMRMFTDSDRAKARYFETELAADDGKGYDLEIVGVSDLRSLDFYKQENVRYFVILPEKYSGSSRKRANYAPFIDTLRRDPELRLRERFVPDPKSRPGPLIEVYEVYKAPSDMNGL